MKTLNLQEAAAFLHVHPETLRASACVGRIPGAKVGRAWVFIEDDLAGHLRSLYPSPRQALRVTLGKEFDPCHFADAVRSGGSTSARPTASEYDDLLAPRAGPSRKNCTTS